MEEQGDESWDVCGSPFWNNTLTWNTSTPDFTYCFERTALIWTPCAFLWVFSPLEVYYLIHSKTRNVPWNLFNITKLAISLILSILCIADVGYAVNLNSKEDGEVYSVSYYTPFVLFASFLLSAVLLVYNRIRGMVTSGLLFFFWFLLCLCGVFQFRTEIERAAGDDPDYSSSYFFISYMIYYPLVFIQFILHCFADKPPLFSEHPPVKNPCPEQTSSALSRLLFAWFDKLAWLGFRKPLETSDLWSMNPDDTAPEVVPKFDKYWEKSVRKNAKEPDSRASFRKKSGSVEFAGVKEKKRKGASILPAISRAFGPTFLFGAILKLVNDCLTFVNPKILELLIGFVEGDDSEWKGYFYAVLMLVTATVQTILLSQYFQRMFLVGLRIRTALISAIYRKALRMSNSSRKESTVGEIVNLMSVDAQRFMDLTTYLNMIWSAPLQIALALYFLWDLLGPSVLAGLAVMIILIPLNGFIASKVKTLQIRQMKNKDERVKLMNEVLSGIKVLKLYAWEPSFEEQILKIRNKEIQVLKEAAYLNAGTSFIWSCAPFLVACVMFGVYVFTDGVLNARRIFVSLSLLNVISIPFMVFPRLINGIIQASVSVKRINRFMNSDELDPNGVSHEESDTHPLTIDNGTFSWDPNEKPTLKNINLQIKQGQLVAVVGTVGSGKSSLISAFLGEMDRISGRVNTKGSIAYVPQQAWIQNATLRDNILFGKTLDGKVYNSVVDACALKPDFDMLPGGDRTEIGEKGINLSGGQKQRVSLARAVYHNSDVYFLDDPLSAVDSHVGKHIFERVIGPSGILRNKTRILVTHGITYLPEVDWIVVLKDGEISETGNYKELLDKKGAFAEFLITHLQESGEEAAEIDLEEIKTQLEGTVGAETIREIQRQISESKSETGSLDRRTSGTSITDINNAGKDRKPSGNINANGVVKPSADKLIEIEKAETGSVKWNVYSHYLKSIGISLSVATVVMNMVFQGFSIGSNVWLSEWSNSNSTLPDGSQDTAARDKYLGVYGALGVGQVVTTLMSTLFLFIGALNAAGILHAHLLGNVLRSPNGFFDVTPLGRILNRFSKEVDVLDNTLPMVLRGWVTCFFSVIATLVVISYSTPIFIAVIIPIGILYYFIQRFYVATSRQLKRIESVSRSPIYSHFGETVTGTQTIRAYNVQSRFIQESEQKVDFNQICYYPSIIANRWLAVRLEMVGNLIIFFAALFAVLSRDTMNSGLVGLSVTYALQITQTLNWLVRMTSDVETNIVAVERIKEYGETPQEAPWDNPDHKPPGDWPKNGDVEFVDYKVRYRENLDLVLHGLSFKVVGGEKVGIVGRTGAGKSSLTLALFRIIEGANGKILIDGIDISKLGLHDLRTRLTIIPQDPVLFSGTVRMNLDPFNIYTDEEIWRALENAHLKSFIQQLALKLDHEVSEGGENLSVGQRQLVCLARALLRKTKILILDEATAAVDLETDDLIQKTIRTEFKECTVLTIAHRLNTILDSDRVIVLDRGLIAEFDNPQKLLSQPRSVFYSMAKDAGITGEKKK